MTEQVGLNNNEGPPPWERVWNDITAIGTKAVDSVTQTVKDAVGSSRMPWERDWSGSTNQEKQIAPAPIKEVGQGFNLEKYIPKLEKVESGGRINIRNPKSSALGLYQFTEGTWKELTTKMNVDYSLKDRTNPEKARKVLEYFTKENIQKAVSDLGRPPEDSEVYMYHLLGRRGAANILKAPTDKPAIHFISAQQADANESIFFHKTGKAKTVKEVLSFFKDKFK